MAPSTNISQKRSPVIAKPFLQTIWILNKLTTITDRASTPRGRSVAFTPGVMPAMRRAAYIYLTAIVSPVEQGATRLWPWRQT